MQNKSLVADYGISLLVHMQVMASRFVWLMFREAEV